MQWFNQIGVQLAQWWAYATSGRLLAVVLGVGFAILAITLFAVSRTKWGQAKPLTKCVVLSVFEENDREGAFVADDPTPFRQFAAEAFGEGEMVFEDPSVGLRSSCAQHQPKTQAQEAARPLTGRDVGIDTVARRHVAGLDGESSLGEGGIADEDHPGTHRDRKPLVSVDGDAVRSFDAFEVRAMFWVDDQSPGPGGVDVEV